MIKPKHINILEQGVDYWNNWREQNPQVAPNLNDTDFRNLKLDGANLSETLLIRSKLDNLQLERINLSRANLYKAKMVGCNLKYADLTSTNIAEANLNNADLTGANLSNSIAHKVNFTKSNLSGTNMKETDLRGSQFIETNIKRGYLVSANCYRTYFKNAILENCDLREVSLKYAKLEKTNLQAANLTWTVFLRTTLDEVDFKDSRMHQTIIGLTNLSKCVNLDKALVSGKCTLDFETLRLSLNIPRIFLKKIGLHDTYINYLPDLYDENPIRLYPVFLSHSWADKPFAKKIYEALTSRGVQVWYDEKQMAPGDDIFDEISRGIKLYDKTILVCSKNSLESWWVNQEITRIAKKEREYQKKESRTKGLIVPITIDDFIYSWDGGKAETIKERVIGDFTMWQDESIFEDKLEELIRSLNVDRKKEKPNSFL